MLTGEKRKRRFWIETALVGMLILTGILLIGDTFAVYGEEFLNNQDEQLRHVAGRVDKNIDSLLERCGMNLAYVTKRRGFLEAEEAWQKTGETEALLYRMKENIFGYDRLVPVMLALKGEEVFLSSDGNLNYRFVETSAAAESGRETDSGRKEAVRICMGETGKLYLAVICEGEAEIRYAALVDPQVFYTEIAGGGLDECDWIILTDTAREILLYNQQGGLCVEETDAVSGATCGSEGVEILLRKQEEQNTAPSSYEYMDAVTGKNYTARMVTLPTEETLNRIFAVGVVTNYEETVRPLKRAGGLLIFYGGMVIAGVLVLMKRMLRFRKQTEDDIEELQIMQEKNDSMSLQNQELKELAHRQRLETIGTLTSGVAHEFNNLLTPIMGYSILTLEQIPADREDLQDNILEIYQASCRAKEITSQLARLSRKNDSSEFQKLAPDELVEKALRVAKPAMPENVELVADLRADGCVVEGSETQLTQMILNLVLNGVQAMEKKEGGVLTVSVFVEGEQAVLKVQDAGCGIKESLRQKLFEPFFTTKEAGKGTGLGLAIVQQVVNEHRGTVRVESREGEGAAFWVYLPIKNL